MSKIKQIEGLVTYGTTVSEAIAKALDSTLTKFAERHGYTTAAVSQALNFYEGRVYSDIRDAICAELAIPREYLDRLIESQRTAEEGVA